jgi:TRAP-type C4-dicarboxylate transport system permease small subunit
MPSNLNSLISAAGTFLASLSLGAYVVTIICDVFARALFAQPIILVSDLGEILIPLALGLVFPVAVVRGAMLAVTFLGKSLSANAERWLNQVTRIVTVGVLTLISYVVFSYASELYQTGRQTVQFGIPLYPVWYLIACGFAISVLALFLAPPSGHSSIIE